VSRIERAALEDVSLSTIERLAEALGATVPSLLSPIERAVPSATELERRERASDELIDAGALFLAIGEAAEPPARYSRAGRPALVR